MRALTPMAVQVIVLTFLTVEKDKMIYAHAIRLFIFQLVKHLLSGNTCHLLDPAHLKDLWG